MPNKKAEITLKQCYKILSNMTSMTHLIAPDMKIKMLLISIYYNILINYELNAILFTVSISLQKPQL